MRKVIDLCLDMPPDAKQMEGASAIVQAAMDGETFFHMKELLQRIESLCPEATITLEMTQTKSSLEWLREKRVWNF